MSATTSLSGLLDTNILIDIIRHYPPAVAWANANAAQRFVIPSLVRMELVLGTGSRQDQRKIVDFLNPYPLAKPMHAGRWSTLRHCT